MTTALVTHVEEMKDDQWMRKLVTHAKEKREEEEEEGLMTDTCGLGGGVRRRKSMDRLLNVASGDACSSE